MMRRWDFLCGVLALAAAVSPATAGDLTVAQRVADKRLQVRVTYSNPDVYLGRLLEEVSRQTGVSVQPGDSRDGAADYRVSVSLRELPLRDVITSIWSLLSFRGAEWDWERSGNAGNYRYRLYRTQRAQLLPARLAELPQMEFEEHARRMMRAAIATPDERAAMAKALGDPILAQFVAMDEDDGVNRVWNGIRVFMECVPEEKRTEVIRGATFRVPYDQLSMATRAYIQHELDLKARAREHFHLPPITDRMPAWIQFSRKEDQAFATPSVYLLLEGSGGGAIFGGTPFGMQFIEAMQKLWMLPGDKATDEETEGRIVPVLPAQKPADAKARPTIRERLAQTADGAAFSWLGLLPARTPDPGGPGGGTVGKALKDMHLTSPWPLRKWREGVLMVTYSRWMYDVLSNVPWATMKALRTAEEKSGGVLRFEDLPLLVDLNEAQLASAGQTFPEALSARQWLPLAMYLHHHSLTWHDLKQPDGVPLRGLLPLLPKEATQDFGDPTVVLSLRLRVVVEEHLDESPPRRRYRFVATTADGSRVVSSILTLRGPAKG